MWTILMINKITIDYVAVRYATEKKLKQWYLEVETSTCGVMGGWLAVDANVANSLRWIL